MPAWGFVKKNFYLTLFYLGYLTDALYTKRHKTNLLLSNSWSANLGNTKFGTLITVFQDFFLEKLDLIDDLIAVDFDKIDITF